jgi:hypothetical protein
VKDWIERKTGILFGPIFIAGTDRVNDYLFVIRIGWGKDRDLVNFEIGILGFGFYVHRTSRKARRT